MKPFDLNSYLQNFAETLAQNGDPRIAEGAAAYMRNQSEFYGIPAPGRRKIQKEFLRNEGIPPYTLWKPFTESCWEYPYREVQYFGMEVSARFIPLSSPDDLIILEFMITRKSWWDTVDYIAANLAGRFFRFHPELARASTLKWMDSKNLWLQRSALLFQLSYKSDTDILLLLDYITELSSENEFFIRKAIGWALRQLSKTHPEVVRNFVETHPLKPLSRKEALKRMNN